MVELENHSPFKKWHPTNLIELLEFIQTRYPEQLEKMLADYDEWLRGN